MINGNFLLFPYDLDTFKFIFHMSEVAKKFGADRVITEHISETDLCTYFVGFDLNPETGKSEYRWRPFIVPVR